MGVAAHTQTQNISILCEDLHDRLLKGYWGPPLRHLTEGRADVAHLATNDGDSVTWWWSKDKKPGSAGLKGDEKGYASSLTKFEDANRIRMTCAWGHHQPSMLHCSGEAVTF